MAAALPVTKIAALLVKTLAKPVSKRIKHEFSKNTTTASGLVWIGQTSHQITSRLTIWSAGYKVRTVQPLEVNEALKVGSEFVGETFILGVSVAAVVWEYNRSKDKERIKEQKLHDKAAAERAELQAKLRTLDKRLQALETVVQQNNDSMLRVLQGKPKYVKPTDGIVPIDDDNENNYYNNAIITTTNATQQQQPTSSRLSIFLKGEKNTPKGGTTEVLPIANNNNDNNNNNKNKVSDNNLSSNATSLSTTPITIEGQTTESSSDDNEIRSGQEVTNNNDTTSSSSSSNGGWKRWLWPFF